MDSLKQATWIVSKLVRAGFIAYFAGGWVRDYVMGHPSEDIDIATSASPAQIMDLFPGTILVGLAFGVVIVVVEGHQFEVATFRKDLEYMDGRHPKGIEMASPLEDALRRDFTINGMFYDPLEKVIHDYVNGKEDIQKGVIRAIGNPHERFFEDRLRMLRAFRFAARFSFSIELETQEAIRENVSKLFPSVAYERIWQEFNKMIFYPRFDQALIDMHRLALLEVIFPELTSLHLRDLKQIVKIYGHFPANSPPIFYLMELFYEASLEQKVEIGRRLKVSNNDIKLIEFLEVLKENVKREEEGLVENYQWVPLFAHASFDVCLKILAAHQEEDKRSLFIQKYKDCCEHLKMHIQRFQKGQPVVNSLLLKQEGVKPGKLMGSLLKEAERIAINQDLQDPALVLNELKQRPLWLETLQ